MYDANCMKKGVFGFTLLEVMIAMAIIAIALTSILRLQAQSLSLASEARFYTTAPLLAQSRMASIMTSDPEELRSDSGDFGEDFSDYTWQASVEELTIDGTQEFLNLVKRIDLNVIWNNSDNFKYNITFYRYVPETK
jgi:general secretion pathway protein I